MNATKVRVMKTGCMKFFYTSETHIDQLLVLVFAVYALLSISPGVCVAVLLHSFQTFQLSHAREISVKITEMAKPIASKGSIDILPLLIDKNLHANS